MTKLQEFQKIYMFWFLLVIKILRNIFAAIYTYIAVWFMAILSLIPMGVILQILVKFTFVSDISDISEGTNAARDVCIQLLSMPIRQT